MTSLLKILDEKIKQDKNHTPDQDKNHTPDFELAISWTPDPNNEGDKIYNWALVKPNFPDSDYYGYSSLEIQGHEWQYMGIWHRDYPKNIMSLEDFFEGYFEGYFEDRETSTQIDNFFKQLKKSYIKTKVESHIKTKVSEEVRYNKIFELMNKFLVRYVNKFLIYTNKISDSTKLEDLYKLYMEYTDENIITYIKNYADKKLDFENIVNTSEKGFYIAAKKKDSEDSEDSEDSKEYVWTFITEEGKLKVYEAMHLGSHKIYDHPYDEFFTLENFFDKYIKGSIEIDEVEEDKFFKSLSPKKLKKSEPQYEKTFTPFFEKNSTKNLFRNDDVPKPERLSERLFRLQELYYKFDKIAELKNAEPNKVYLNFLKNKIGTDKADAELFKECSAPELYINTTDNKLYLGYCGIFQGYHNSIDNPEKFYPPPTSPAQSLIKLYDLGKHIEKLETLEINCRYKTSRSTDFISGDWDTTCGGDKQKNLDKIRKKILENISNKNDLITINNAQKIYNFLFNNFHIKGKDENENENIGKIMKNDFLKDIHDSVEKMEVGWNVNELGILYKQGVTTKFHPADKIKNLPGGMGKGQVFEEGILKKLSEFDLDKDMNVEAILKHRTTWYIQTPLKIKINEFLTSEIKQNKNVNKENIKVYSEYEPQLFQKMFNTHLDLLEFVIEENCDIFFKIIFKDKYYNNKYYKVGTSEMIEKMDEFTGNLDIETTKKIIDKLITAINYLEISDIDKIIFSILSETKKNNILNNTYLNLDDTVELIKHINQHQSNANSYFLEKIKAESSKKVHSADNLFLNIPPPPLPLDLPLFTLEGDSIKDKQTHFNKIKEEYEEQKGKYIDEYYNYNSKIKELNDLISIINDDPQYKQHIKDPQEKWKEEPAYHGKREEDLQNLRNRLLELEKAQVKEDLAKFKKAQIYRESPEFYADSARDLMIFLIKNINILLDETQLDLFLKHINKITENEEGIKKMFAENITIEKFSSYIANENIEEPAFLWSLRNSGMMITFQKLIKTLFDSNNVFRFKFNEYEWSWNGVSQKINTHENPYERYKTFFHNIDRFKKEFLDKTQSVQNGKINSYEYYIKLIYDSTYMKYKDSLYIIFILHEQGVTNLTNLIETLPETGRDKNILNNFIENIIYNNIDKKKFIKVLDILYEKHPANYIEIFEQAILENYENILKFIDTEDKPEYIKYIYEKYEKCLISNSNDIYYKKPSNENPFAKTPFISYEKIQSYYKKNETSEKKKIIKVGKNNQKYYFSYVKQTRQKPTSKWQPVDRIEYLEKVEDKNVFILNNNPEMIFINFAELENDEKYNKVKNVSKLKEKFKNLLYEPLEVEEYKFKDEISDPYQQKTDELNAEQPDNLTLALALGNAST